MFTFKITGKAQSLARQEIEIPCPRCRLHNWVSFGQVLRSDFVVCRGCHANVLLDDQMGAVRKTVRRFDAAFKNLLQGER